MLDAAAAILDEHGYAHMTIRNVAARAGTSVGVIYRYFIDKQDIFVALLLESQQNLTQFLITVPRDEGVVRLLTRTIPETTAQWSQVGRLVPTWHQAADYRTENTDRRIALLESTAAQFSALSTALLEAASGEGRPLRQGHVLLPFVWAGLMGIADTLTNHWAQGVLPESFIDYSAESLAQAITAFPNTEFATAID